MSKNKATVQRYFDGFRNSDHAQILSCLTDDVEWFGPGAYHLQGKEAYDGEIENDAFVGSPAIEITPTRRGEQRRHGLRDATGG